MSTRARAKEKQDKLNVVVLKMKQQNPGCHPEKRTHVMNVYVFRSSISTGYTYQLLLLFLGVQILKGHLDESRNQL